MTMNLKKFKPSTRVRNIALGIALTSSAITHTANAANFLENFYNSAGASANYTAPQVYQNQAMGVVNGGSFVFKAPVRNLNAFTFTPPSLKAGCGGIDVFMGAFGFANKEQFVQFLKNVGQNSMGLAFKVALNAISPDLASEIDKIAAKLNEMMRFNMNSCEAAKALMDAGPGKWLHDTVVSAKGAALEALSGDSHEAEQKYKTDSYQALSDAPDRKNSGGFPVETREQNITYAALNSGNIAGMTMAEQQLILALLGGTIFKKTEDGANITGVPFPHLLDNVSDMVGSVEGTVDIPIYSCGFNECLTVTPASINQKGFAALVYDRAKRIRDNIINRTMNDEQDIRAMSLTTSIPLYKIIAVTALPSMRGNSEVFLQNYSTAVGWEIASYYIETVAGEATKLLRNAIDGQTGTQQREEAIKKLLDRIKGIQSKMVQDRAQVYAQIAKDGAMIAQIEQINRQLYSNIPASVAANTSIGRVSR